MKWFSQHLKKRSSANTTKNKPKLETLSERKTWTGLETVSVDTHLQQAARSRPPPTPGTQDSQAGLARTQPTVAHRVLNKIKKKIYLYEMYYKIPI